MNLHIPNWLLYWMLYSSGFGLLAEAVFGRLYVQDWQFLVVLALGLIFSLLRCYFVKEEKDNATPND